MGTFTRNGAERQLWVGDESIEVFYIINDLSKRALKFHYRLESSNKLFFNYYNIDVAVTCDDKGVDGRESDG